MILKPINMSPNGGVFTASEPIEVTWKNTGDVMVAFEVAVYKNTGEAVFNSGKISSYIAKYSIPANTLVNNQVYKYTIKVYNVNNESATSDFKILSCYTRPVITIPSDGYIRNQIASFSATYSQYEGIVLKAYKYILYDEYDNVIEQSDYLYDGLLAYSFEYRLVDDTQYKVECIAITQNDLLGTSGKITFTADYIPPQVYFNLDTEAYVDKPYVRLLWTTVRIIGKKTGTTSYIADSKLNVLDGEVYFDEGFSLQDDFSIKMWVEGISEEQDIVYIGANLSQITVRYYGGRLHLFKTYAGVTNHISTSNIGNITQSNVLFVVIQQEKGKMNIKCEVIE